MKYLLLFILFAATIGCYAQTITGTVADKRTLEPVNGALVSVGTARVFTNTQGEFSIDLPALADSLKIIHFAYKPYTVHINKSVTPLHIWLQPTGISLNGVTIQGSRNFKKDSINNRLEYSKQFNYKGPRVIDAFIPSSYQPGQFISINLLTLIQALTKKSTNEYKFNKILIRDEQADYVDHKFNRGIVEQITNLKADSLSAFIAQYRPAFSFTQQASDYDMQVYIKDCLKKFQKEGFKGTDPFKGNR
jgi:hypothetical protein